MLNSHDYFERRVRAAAREREELWDRPPIIQRLSEPIQRGWRRAYILAPHAEARWDRDILAAILKLINTVQYSRRPDFRKRVSRSRKRVELEQPLQRVFDRRWEKLKLPSLWRPYFRWIHYSEWGRPRYYGEFRHPHLFELRSEPHLVWEVLDVDPEAETRYAELAAWMRWNRPVECHLWGRWRSHSPWRGEPTPRAKALAEDHERQIRAAMCDPLEADPATPARRGPVSLQRWRNGIRLFLEREPDKGAGTLC